MKNFWVLCAMAFVVGLFSVVFIGEAEAGPVVTVVTAPVRAVVAVGRNVKERRSCHSESSCHSKAKKVSCGSKKSSCHSETSCHSANAGCHN